jgi:tetratricopeptide (TPR) repeat protein
MRSEQVDASTSVCPGGIIGIRSLEQRIALRKRTGDLGAWATYERGLWHFALCGIDENERARDLLQRSIKLDPELSKAYQWLVYVYVQDGIHYRTRPIEEAHGVAEELAMKAIVLDPDDAGAYAALGFVAQMGNDLPRALANAERALTLNPNDGDALRLKGACQLGLGLGAEGAVTLRMSVQLRPSDPLNWRAPHHLCWYSYLAGDYAAGAEAGRAALRANASQCLTHAWLAASLAQVGKTAEAQDVMARAAKLVAPLSFSDHVRRRLPWVQEEGHARMLDGLRKVGWRG